MHMVQALGNFHDTGFHASAAPEQQSSLFLLSVESVMRGIMASPGRCCFERGVGPDDLLRLMRFNGLTLLSSTSALKAVFKICVGFVDILRRVEFPSLRIFGTTEVVVGHPLGTEQAQVVRTSKPTYPLAWLIPCGLAQALLQKCTYKDISPSRQAVVFLGIFNMGVLSRTSIISSETKKFPKPDCLLEFPEGP